MTRTSREGQFKIEQRVGESVDVTLLRCFMKSLRYIDYHTAQAAIQWMHDKAEDRKTWHDLRSSAAQRKE